MVQALTVTALTPVATTAAVGGEGFGGEERRLEMHGARAWGSAGRAQPQIHSARRLLTAARPRNIACARLGRVACAVNNRVGVEGQRVGLPLSAVP